jgi:BMFP domain-containing protein YqiC
MKFNNPLFEDFSKVAGSAAETVAAICNQGREHFMQRRGASGDTVSREEFEAVAAMAAKAREEQDALKQRIEALEALIHSGGA